jgi:uncharacterized protein
VGDEEREVIRNETRETVVATETRWARDPVTRFFGLMGKATLASGASLIFPGEKGIHTHFMRFPIDVVFYAKEPEPTAAQGHGGQAGQRVRVVHVIHAMKPWRFSPYRLDAHGVIELPPGALEAALTKVGDHLRLT